MLARFGNFARAAEALHLSQPTLSRNIAALEVSLGVLLFDRGKQGVEPTAFGRLLVERGQTLLNGAADLQREIALLAQLEIGSLAIGAGPYATELSIGTAVTRLLRQHPRLRVEVLTADADEISRGVLSGRLDVGVAGLNAAQHSPLLEAEPLAGHDLFFACRPGHPLVGRAKLSLDDLLRYPLVAPVFAGPAAAAAASGERGGVMDAESQHFRPTIHVNTLALARQIARDSDAVMPATASMLAVHANPHRLVRLDFHIAVMRTSYGVLTHRDRSLSPAAIEFLTILREVEAEIVAAPALAAAASRAVAA